MDRLIGQMAELGSKCPGRFGQGRGRVAAWARRALHCEVLREFARCRHQALGCALLRPTTAPHAGDPEGCRQADGSPQGTSEHKGELRWGLCTYGTRAKRASDMFEEYPPCNPMLV